MNLYFLTNYDSGLVNDAIKLQIKNGLNVALSDLMWDISDRVRTAMLVDG